jgi:hypothetical protein
MSLILQFYFKLAVYSAGGVFLNYETPIRCADFAFNNFDFRLQSHTAKAAQKAQGQIWL